MLVIEFQCYTSSASVGLMTHHLPILCEGGVMGTRVPVIPPLTLFFHVNGAAVLYPGHHLPFFWVWAPSTLDVSHCLRVSKQKVVSRHGFLKPKKLLHQQHEPAVHQPTCDRGWGLLACPVCGNIGAIRHLFCCEYSLFMSRNNPKSVTNSAHSNPRKLWLSALR